VPSDNSFASVPPTSYNGWKEYSLRTTQLSALYLQAEVSSVSARRCRSSDEVLSNRLPRTSSPMEKDPEGRRLQGILIMPGRMHSKNRSTSCARGFATTIISSIIAYVFPCDISRIIRCFISSCLSRGKSIFFSGNGAALVALYVLSYYRYVFGAMDELSQQYSKGLLGRQSVARANDFNLAPRDNVLVLVYGSINKLLKSFFQEKSLPPVENAVCADMS
ncbi:hypothetical protein M513_05551, partial [Trichuris suis]